MALSDADEAKLREELETTKKQLAELLEEKKQQSLPKPDDEETKKKNEKPTQPKVDPDIVKAIEGCMKRIEEIEKRLGTETKPGEKKSGNPFLFGI